MPAGRPISQEKLDVLRLAVDENWPLREIIRTHNVRASTIKKYFPEHQPMSPQESGTISQMHQRFNRIAH